MKRFIMIITLISSITFLLAWEEPTFKLSYQNSIAHGPAFGYKLKVNSLKSRENYLMASCLFAPNYQKEKSYIASVYWEKLFIRENNFYTKIIFGAQVFRYKWDIDDEDLNYASMIKLAVGGGYQWEIDDGIFIFLDADIGMQLILFNVNLGIKF